MMTQAEAVKIVRRHIEAILNPDFEAAKAYVQRFPDFDVRNARAAILGHRLDRVVIGDSELLLRLMQRLSELSIHCNRAGDMASNFVGVLDDDDLVPLYGIAKDRVKFGVGAPVLGALAKSRHVSDSILVELVNIRGNSAWAAEEGRLRMIHRLRGIKKTATINLNTRNAEQKLVSAFENFGVRDGAFEEFREVVSAVAADSVFGELKHIKLDPKLIKKGVIRLAEMHERASDQSAAVEIRKVVEYLAIMFSDYHRAIISEVCTSSEVGNEFRDAMLPGLLRVAYTAEYEFRGQQETILPPVHKL